MLGAALDIFSQEGMAFLSRWAHVVVGITWIGLLYYFNFVQVPAFAEMEAAARNNTIDKLASRALWWFRWAAVATVVSGLLILGFQGQLDDASYMKTPAGISIATGVLLALTMFANVWGVIWRNQKAVIANARNVQAGGEADPTAADSGRRALLASRQNVIFSLPMLVFMVLTSHMDPLFISTAGFDVVSKAGDVSGGKRGLYWAITLVVFLAFELNALGVIGGRKPGATNIIYDTHKNALIAGGVYTVFMYLVFSFVLAA